MVFVLWSQPACGTIAQPQSAAFGLLPGNLQAQLPPDPLDSFVIHSPAFPTKQRSHSSIPIPTVSAGELDDSLGKQSLVVANDRTTTLGGSGLLEDFTCPALGDIQLVLDMFDGFAPFRRA